MTDNGHYKTLKKTYRNLFEDFSHSQEYKKHCEDLSFFLNQNIMLL